MDKASPQSTTEVPAKADAVPDPSDGDSKSLNAKSSQQCIVCKKVFLFYQPIATIFVLPYVFSPFSKPFFSVYNKRRIVLCIE